jgi:hypothetical protein
VLILLFGIAPCNVIIVADVSEVSAASIFSVIASIVFVYTVCFVSKVPQGERLVSTRSGSITKENGICFESCHFQDGFRII